MLMTFHPRAIQAMDSILSGVRETIYYAQIAHGELTWEEVETEVEEAIAEQYTYADNMFTQHLQMAFHHPYELQVYLMRQLRTEHTHVKCTFPKLLVARICYWLAKGAAVELLCQDTGESRERIRFYQREREGFIEHLKSAHNLNEPQASAEVFQRLIKIWDDYHAAHPHDDRLAAETLKSE